MHFIAITLCALIVTFTSRRVQGLTEEELQESVKSVQKECQSQTKASDELIEGMKRGEWNDEPEAQCYIFCSMRVYELVDEDMGKFNEKRALDQIGVLPEPRQEPTKVAIEKCKGSDVGDNKCQSAYNFAKCFYFADPKLFTSR